MLAFPASGRFGGALAGIWRYTVKFDTALALQLRSQNVLLIAEALSDIEDVTWKVLKERCELVNDILGQGMASKWTLNYKNTESI